MSYILEALKKSEQERERERGGLPGIKSVHAPSSSLHKENRRWWPFVLIAVFVVVGAVLTFVYVKTISPLSLVSEQADQSSPATSVDRQSAQLAADPPVEQAVKPRMNKASPGEKTAVENTATSAEQKKHAVVFSEQQLQLDDVMGNVDEQREQAAAQQKAKPIEKGSAESDDAVAISDIPDSIRKRIPNIAFEGHVYSSIPERRSIMINGHKRREGDTIGGDLLVKEITGEGAEFEFQGYRFRLNALQDWSFK